MGFDLAQGLRPATGSPAVKISRTIERQSIEHLP